jgi:TRAP-type C4-dicarboxylate transport system substrate-binding protein
MKSSRKFALATLLVLLPMFFSVSFCSAGTETLSMSHIFPASHFVHTRLTTQWAADVEKATNGALKINVFPGATLLKPAETFEGVVSGTADIAHGICGYTRGRFPTMEAFEIAGIPFSSAAASTMVTVDGIKKFKPKDWDEVKLLVVNSVGPGTLFTKKEIKSLDELKGMRIRATGSTVKPIEALGAIPVAMPNNDTYEALAKGVVDGNIGPPEMLKGWKQADVTDFITTMPPVYNSIMYIVMNLDKWNALPKEVQEAVEKVSADWSLKSGQIWDEEQTKNGIEYGLSQGMKLNHLPEADYAKGEKLMQPIIDDYVKRMEEKGINAKEIIEFVRAKSAEYSKQYPSLY